MSYPLCRDLQEQEQFFDGVFCRIPPTVNFSTGQQYELVSAEIVSGSYFSGARRAPGAGSPHRPVGRCSARRPSGRGALVRLLEEQLSAAPTMSSGATSWSTTIR